MASGVLRLILVAAIAAGVAWLVAERQLDTLRTNETIQPAPPVRLEDRQLVTLETVTIQPVISGEGWVVPGDEAGSWVIEAAVPPVDAYHLIEFTPVGVKAAILGGPSGFDCSWLEPGPGAERSVVMRCQIPADLPMVEGLAATMVVQLDAPQTVTGLPATAVVAAGDQGQVVVVDDGAATVRDVQVGDSDSFSVEILSGLQPDEQVLLAPIQRDFTEYQP